MRNDRLGERLDDIGRQLEEIIDDNTAFVTELRRVDRAQQETADAVQRAVGALRQDLEAALAHHAVRDLCLSLLGPLTALDEMLATADLADPRVIAGHLRSVSLTLRGVLARMGAEAVPIVVGEDLYDPDRHRCVGVVEPADSPFPLARPNTVVRVVEEGYVLHRRPLRPAQVEIQADRRSPAATQRGVS
jgi:molecular chaperone GrpE (heat shock protein)